HNDILSSGLDSAFSIDQNLTGKTDIDLRRARQGGLDVQVFTICSDTERVHPFHYACQLLDTLHAWAARNPHTMKLVFTHDDLTQTVNQKIFGAMAGIEGGYVIENDLSKLDSLFKRGVRYMGLIHISPLSWATSDADKTSNSNKGLNDFGR